VVKLYEKKKRFLKKILAHFSDIFYFNLYDSNNVFLNIGFEKIILHSGYNFRNFCSKPMFSSHSFKTPFRIFFKS